MKRDLTLTIASLLVIVLFVFHLTDDIMHGYEAGLASQLPGMLGIPLVMLIGTLMLSERRLGYIIMFLGGILAVGVTALHMRGKGVGGEFAKTSGAFFFVWTLLMLGLSGSFSVILSLRGLWNLRKGRTRE